MTGGLWALASCRVSCADRFADRDRKAANANPADPTIALRMLLSGLSLMKGIVGPAAGKLKWMFDCEKERAVYAVCGRLTGMRS